MIKAVFKRLETALRMTDDTSLFDTAHGFLVLYNSTGALMPFDWVTDAGAMKGYQIRTRQNFINGILKRPVNTLGHQDFGKDWRQQRLQWACQTQNSHRRPDRLLSR